MPAVVSLPYWMASVWRGSATGEVPEPAETGLKGALFLLIEDALRWGEKVSVPLMTEDVVLFETAGVVLSEKASWSITGERPGEACRVSSRERV